MAANIRGPVRVLVVGDAGISLSHGDEVILDVTFDGRRIWSFWLCRDSEGVGDNRRVAWPVSLLKFLDGVTQLGILEHLSGRVLYDAETQFGSGTGRIAIVNEDGRPLGIDKSGRMAQTFDTRSSEHVAPLLDAVEQVLGALSEAGVDAFPAYGTLLGAVREGRLIGHDSDADLGYVSRHEHPFEVIRESFELQRRLAAAGYAITRYSGAAFKVDVVEGDGSVRGLDVFGGFLSFGNLYLMGEVGQPFEREWITPLGTCTLEGRTLPAPADPARMLAAMYGSGWRVPDPAFRCETSRSTTRRLNGWFRGTRVFRDEWERRYSTRRNQLPARGPSSLAEFVVAQEGVPARLVDIGAGRGGDAHWFAAQGSSVTAYDYVPTASLAVRRVVEEQGLDLTVRRFNLLEWRSTFGEGARLAHTPGPRTVLARHVADATTDFGRDSLWRFASMALRDGGRLYVEALAGDGMAPLERAVPVTRMVDELGRHGADIVQTQDLEAPGRPGRRIGRLVAQWRT
ncbi:MAG: class I SAM-dependent methyltransferase [Actinomycetota bacterium]|nr:class I SAM-dependent methyltransferase [Actinomycetota bacterium]